MDVIALLVAGRVGIFAFIRLRKKKKEANLLADDLALIDQDKNV